MQGQIYLLTVLVTQKVVLPDDPVCHSLLPLIAPLISSFGLWSAKWVDVNADENEHEPIDV